MIFLYSSCAFRDIVIEFSAKYALFKPRAYHYPKASSTGHVFVHFTIENMQYTQIIILLCLIRHIVI